MVSCRGKLMSYAADADGATGARALPLMVTGHLMVGETIFREGFLDSAQTSP